MPALYTVQSRASGGGQIASADINQLVNTLTGNQNTPVSVKNTDPIAYTLQLQNTDAAGKTLLLYGPDGTTVILRSQANGVVASPDGTAAASIVTTTHAQTVSGKTLTSPVVSGAGGTAAGTLGFSGASLLVGDGTVNETVGPLGAWTAFAPTLTQGVALTLSSAVGRYMQIGKTVIASVDITINSAGTSGSAIVLGGLPVASAARGGMTFGVFFHNPNFYSVTGKTWQTTTSFDMVTGGPNSGAIGVAPAFAVAASDILRLTIMYEAA